MNLVYLNEKARREEYEKLTKEQLIIKLLEIEEEMIDAHYEALDAAERNSL